MADSSEGKNQKFDWFIWGGGTFIILSLISGVTGFSLTDNSLNTTNQTGAPYVETSEGVSSSQKNNNDSINSGDNVDSNGNVDSDNPDNNGNINSENNDGTSSIWGAFSDRNDKDDSLKEWYETVDGLKCSGNFVTIRRADGGTASVEECYNPDGSFSFPAWAYNSNGSNQEQSQSFGTLGNIVRWFGGVGDTAEGEKNVVERFYDYLKNYTLFRTFPKTMLFLYIISFLLLVLIINLMARIDWLLAKVNAKVIVPNPQDVPDALELKNSLTGSENTRWEEVNRLLETESEGMWKLAILEADVMLGEMLTSLGYDGDIGTQLKSVDPNTFQSYNEAWTAHKVRNKIAHEGKDFRITYEQAKATIELYEIVFNEWQYI